MDLSTIERRFLKKMQQHPNTTAFLLNGEIVTNALYIQRVAPIMNELDTMPVSKIAILIEDDLQNYAALPAVLFVGKQLIPMKKSWTEEQRQQVMQHAGIDFYLTAQRMHYYFRMTYEDAMDRVGSELLREPQAPIALLYDFEDDVHFTMREIFMNDIPEHDDLPRLVYSFCQSY